MEQVLFLVIISLLLIHEMDAIKVKEWKMFVVLKNMTKETDYIVFALIHLPLYFVVLYILFRGSAAAIYMLKIVLDIFLIAHAVLHYGFRKHRENGFKMRFSKIVIYSMFVMAFLHIFLLLRASGFGADGRTVCCLFQ